MRWSRHSKVGFMDERPISKRRKFPTPFQVRPNNEGAKDYDLNHWWVYYPGGVLEIYKIVNGEDELQAVYAGSWTLIPEYRSMPRMS